MISLSSVHPSLWHYLVFPVDAWRRPQHEDFVMLKRDEVWPIMRILLPLIVLAAGFSLELNFFSGLLFYALEAALLAVVAHFYLKLQDLAQTLDLFFNFWGSFMLLTLVAMMVMGIVGIFL